MNDEWEEITNRPTASRQTPPVAKPAPVNAESRAKAIAHSEAIEGHLITLQRRFEELKYNRTHYNSRRDAALAPVECEMDAIDAEELTAIMAGKPIPADVQKRRADLIDRRATIGRDCEIEADNNAAEINALVSEIERVSKGFEKTGGTPSMLRERQQRDKDKAKQAIPVDVRFTTNLGTDEWQSFKRDGLIASDATVPRDGNVVTLPRHLAQAMVARGLATETE